MSYFDYDYPADEKEFSCNVCEKPIDKPGVCSNKCFKIDMEW